MKRLVIRPGAIGDAVVSLPAVEHLCRGAEEAEIWCPTENIPIFAGVAATRSLMSTGFDSLEWPDMLIARLRRMDDIVSWSGTARDDLRARVEELRLPFRFLTAVPGEECGVHAVDYYLAQVGAEPGAIPRLKVERRDEGYAVIHPFSGSPRKNWPLERFREVARLLPMRVAWCAGPEEALADAQRFDSLAALIPWLAGARLYIGNDSGISHLAAACGVPVVAVFGPTNPVVWAPRGERVEIADWDWPPERVAQAALAF